LGPGRDSGAFVDAEGVITAEIVPGKRAALPNRFRIPEMPDEEDPPMAGTTEKPV
jgi:hypothetical protein